MKDPYVVMLVTLTNKIQEQADQIEGLYNERNDLYDRIEGLVDERQAADNRNHDLICKVNRLENDLAYWNGQLALHQRPVVNVASLADLDNWMASEGMAMFNRPYPTGGKISCIKIVRERGCLGLKEAKDYVEAYVASHSDSVPA